MARRWNVWARGSSRRGAGLCLLATLAAVLFVCAASILLAATNGAARSRHAEAPPPPLRLKHRAQGEALLAATRLLSLLGEFADSPARGVFAGGFGEAAGNTSAATPASVLAQHYEYGLTRRNSEYENDLDSGYAEHVQHSDTYWSPFHAIRRGYGMEGSIFVGVVHSDERSTWAKGERTEEAACAMTVKNMYDAARWPVGVFAGIVEVTVDTRAQPAPASSSTSPDAKQKNQNSSKGPSLSPPPPSICIPRAYQSPSCVESFGFCPTDNIRVRQVRVRPLSENGAYSSPHRKPRSAFSSIAARRYATLTLYRGETYVMFVRSGLRFVPHWDALTRLLWLQLPSHRAVLSQSPLLVEDATVRRVWASVVEKRVDEIVAAAAGSGSSTATPTDQNSTGKQPSGHSEKKFPQWALDANALRLNHDEKRIEGELLAENRGDLGITVEEIMNYVVLRSSATAAASHKNDDLDVDVNVSGDAARSTKTRRDIQTYWLHHFRDALWKTLQEKMRDQETTSCLCGIQMREQGPHEPHESLFTLRTSTVRRRSRALQDPRYMQPLSLHWCENKDEGACAADLSTPTKEHSGVHLPFMHQPFATTDFFFTRAEAFFDFSQRGKDSDPGARRAFFLQLDPYLSFLTPDEEAVLLSARLWTHGWDFFSPTEPIAFASAGPDAGEKEDEEEEKKAAGASATARQRSLARLRRVLFGGAAADAGALRDVGRYSLGGRRSREKMLRFLGIREGPGDAGSDTTGCASWCAETTQN